MSPFSVQERLDLESVAHDVARFGSGARAHRLAVLEWSARYGQLVFGAKRQRLLVRAKRDDYRNLQISF